MSKIEKYFEHLSLSTINLFIRDKSKFCLKASGLEDSMGNPAMLRGRAVENQLLTVPIYKERNIEELINDADVFYQTESLEFDKTIEKEKIEKERLDVPKYIMSGYPFYYNLKDKGLTTQRKVTYNLSELNSPILGFIDLECLNTIRDLKTTRAIPSAVPHMVQRQLAFYSHVSRKQAWVDYVSKKHCTTYRIDNVEKTMNEILAICQSIEKFLSISDDIKEIASMFPPNLDSWEWSEEDNINWKKLGV